MDNQPAIDSLNIKIATLEAEIANWENKALDALTTGSQVAGRMVANEARAAREALDEVKRELRKIELGY